jgi:subfamily B ATP-binding cassette protein MsbA
MLPVEAMVRTPQTSETPRGATLRRLLSYFRPHLPTLVLASLLVVVSSLVPVALVFLVRTMLDDVLIARDRAGLTVLPLLVIGLYAIGGAAAVARGLLTRKVAWSVVTQVRRELFVHYLRQDVLWHQKRPTGELVARLMNDVNDVQLGMSGIVTAVQKPLSLVGLIASAFVMNPKLAAIALPVIPFVAIPIERFGRSLRASARSSLDNLAGLSASASETLTGIRVVQSMGGESTRLARFDSENERQKELQMRTFLAQLLPGPVIELIAAVGVGLVIWVGGQQVLAGEIEPGALVAFLVALGLLNDPLKGIAQIHSLMQRALAGAESVFHTIDSQPRLADRGTVQLAHEPVEIAFEDVAFDYGEGPVLEGVSFRMQQGRTVALVGASGSGKSTIAALVTRFVDPTRGRVLANGKALPEYTLASWRRQVGFVSQDTFLFDDTIRANIAFGSEATQAQVEAAARVANAHDFIATLPHRYDTRIDELGLRLSGGQRQRICIARAVLRDAPVLVLDEATSALDTESEALVQEALDRLRKDRTVLLIAHRLSTIRDADEILVLEGGRIVERGDHDVLVARGGAYSRLVGRQFAT